MVDLKEKLVDGDIYSYSWLPTKELWADIMKKEIKIPPSLEDIIMKNVMDLPKPLVNEVKAVGTDICMTNRRNR